jgi:hypothetical protein
VRAGHEPIHCPSPDRSSIRHEAREQGPTPAGLPAGPFVGTSFWRDRPGPLRLRLRRSCLCRRRRHRCRCSARCEPLVAVSDRVLCPACHSTGWHRFHPRSNRRHGGNPCHVCTCAPRSSGMSMSSRCSSTSGEDNPCRGDRRPHSNQASRFHPCSNMCPLDSRGRRGTSAGRRSTQRHRTRRGSSTSTLGNRGRRHISSSIARDNAPPGYDRPRNSRCLCRTRHHPG